jgi:hypothetical protein
MNQAALVAAALSYAERGWPVYPLGARSKAPYAGLAPHGFLDASTDLAVVRDWWRAAPHANVGLRTGLAFDVLDIDAAAPTDKARIVAILGPDAIKTTPVAKSHHGHHVYLAPSGTRTHNKFIPGLDWRAQGGCIVAPPSLHPDGGGYCWLSDPSSALLVAPPELLALVVRPEPAALQRPCQLRPLDSVRAGSYGAVALAGEAAKVRLSGDDDHNNSLFRAACKLFELVAGGELGADQVTQVLTDAALAVGQSPNEIRCTLTSARTRASKAPRQAPPLRHSRAAGRAAPGLEP